MRRIFQCRKGEVTEEWRNIYNEELHKSYYSPNILAVVVVLFILRTVRSMINFGRFHDCLPLVPIL
jgi:hypothetical protein